MISSSRNILEFIFEKFSTIFVEAPRNSAWKIHRMKPIDQIQFKPQTIDIFKNIVTGNIVKMHNLAILNPLAKAYTSMW